MAFKNSIVAHLYYEINKENPLLSKMWVPSDIFNFKMTEETDLIPNELPISQISFDALDPNGYFSEYGEDNAIKNISVNAEVKVYRNYNNVSHEIGLFYLKEISVNGEVVSVKAQSLASLLDSEEINLGLVNQTSVGTLLDLILGANNYEVDDNSILTKEVYGYFGKDTKRNQLLKLMFLKELNIITQRRNGKPLIINTVYSYQKYYNSSRYTIEHTFQNTTKLIRTKKYGNVNYKITDWDVSENDEIVYQAQLEVGNYNIKFDNETYITSITGATQLDNLPQMDTYINKYNSILKLDSVNIKVENSGTVIIRGKKLTKVQTDKEFISGLPDPHSYDFVTEEYKKYLDETIELSNDMFVDYGNTTITDYNLRFRHMLEFISQYDREYEFEYDLTDFDGEEKKLLALHDFVSIVLPSEYDYIQKFPWGSVYAQKMVIGYVTRLETDLSTNVAKITLRAQMSFRKKQYS